MTKRTKNIINNSFKDEIVKNPSFEKKGSKTPSTHASSSNQDVTTIEFSPSLPDGTTIREEN